MEARSDATLFELFTYLPMDSNLPTSDENNQTGRLGVSQLQVIFEKEGWIFRRQAGDDDFGIDGEIEIVERNKVTGRIAKCQVKSSKMITFKDGESSVSVKTSTYNLWKATPTITILFHVDTSSGTAYWTPALAHHPRPGASSFSVKFDESNDLRHGLSPLRAYLDSWFTARAGDAMLREIPPFHAMYERLKSDVDHYDAWSELAEAEDGDFRLFYRHALRLRLEVGLSNDELPSLDDWYMRNSGLWNGDSLLFRGTFSEAMKLIGQAYQEALSKVVERVKSTELTVENQDLWNFAGRITTARHIQQVMVDHRESDPEFHAAIEAKLKAIGALKFSFQARKS